MKIKRIMGGAGVLSRDRRNKRGAIRKFVITIAIPFVLLSCNEVSPENTSASLLGTSISANDSAGKKGVTQQKNLYADAVINIKIIPAANNSFGYDIFLNGRPLVHQPNIPGLPGNEGFCTKKSAQKIAEYVVKKIRENEMPPTVTIEDLTNLGVLK